MRTPHFVGPKRQSTPAELRSSRGSTRAIPDDLLREASRRLGIMSLVGAALWFLGTVFGRLAFHALQPDVPGWNRLHSIDSVAITSIVVSLALFVYSRGDRDPAFVLDLGLIHMVYTGLALGLIIHWYPISRTLPVQPMISWAGALVLMYAAMVPSPPGRFMVAALVTVSMTPLSMLIAKARGSWDFGPVSNALVMHYPDFLLLGVAVVISHVVTRLGQQVSKAREMGSYRLGELLGRGGMGEVYKADHRLLARPAAIKLIRPEMLHGDDGNGAELAVRRFHREAEVAANLRSPHTVELYDFGLTDDETLYFVMELLDGMDLETLVRQHGPLPAGRAIHILRQVCDSLEEAHAYGMVHRDIKPANIHLGRVGLRHDFVKVLDFGLVKPMAGAADGEHHSLVTGTGLTPGTPAYMAPEMSLGETVDGRADLYAVGCVAYYLLTGRLVFEAEHAVQLIVKHLEAEPVPPSRRAPHPVPAELDAAVLRCLAKKPADRPRTAGELARALAAIETEPWGEEQAAAWWAAARRS